MWNRTRCKPHRPRWRCSDAIHALIERLRGEQALSDLPLAEETLQLVLMALGDALLGQAMAKALGLPRTRARDLAKRALLHTREGN